MVERTHSEDLYFRLNQKRWYWHPCSLLSKDKISGTSISFSLIMDAILSTFSALSAFIIINCSRAKGKAFKRFVLLKIAYDFNK
jgi:hypothetical protein